MYVSTKARSGRKTRRPIDIHQNKWPKGYISTIANSRRPMDSFADLTNMEIVQDSIPRIRQSLVPYGAQPTLTICGRGSYTQGGARKLIFMMNDGSNVGKVYTQTDGGAFTLIGGTYDTTVWTGFCQSNNRVYIYNGIDKLSYFDLTSDTLVTYTPLTTPGAPTATKTNLGSTTFTYYYKVSANNVVGTSASSSAGTAQVSKERTAWNGISHATPEYVTVTWAAVAGASSYNIYVGNAAGFEQLVYTVVGTTWIDDGQTPSDPYTVANSGNSTEGPILNWLYNDSRSSQLFGIDNENTLWYSAAGTGDFSPYNGGGYAPIDENGASKLNYVDGFRDGKGTPVITVGARGAAGRGLMFHVTFTQTTVGGEILLVANVYEANGQSAPYAPRAVIKAKDSLWYPTGQDFKSTGTSQNVVNILTTNSIAQGIMPDVDMISLANMHKAVGVEYQDKLYFALPVNSTENNEIWYMDLARKNLWVLRWTVAAKDLWLYEDSNGATHFCALVNNRVLEFTRAVDSEDDGVAFNTRVGYSSLVWDEDGLVMANIRKQYYKFLNPKGAINIGVYGLNKDGVTNSIGSETYQQFPTMTGIGVWDYSGDYKYGDDVGSIKTFSKSIGSKKVKINAKMINQLDYFIETTTRGCDYLLSAVNTIGNTNDKRKLGD